MIEPTWSGKRLVLLAALLLFPLLSSYIGAAIAVLMAVLIAVDGLGTARILIYAGTLVLLEIIWGLPLGLYSLPLIVAVVLLSVISKVVLIRPLSASDGWQVGELLRAWLVAVILAMTIFCLPAVIFGYVYGSGATLLRLRLAILQALLILPPLCAIGIIFIRRLDIPFRKRVTFGT